VSAAGGEGCQDPGSPAALAAALGELNRILADVARKLHADATPAGLEDDLRRIRQLADRLEGVRNALWLEQFERQVQDLE
jgi:hypothetical protein